MGAKRQRTSGANAVPSPAPHVGPPPPPAPGTSGYNMHCPPAPVSLMTSSALDASLDRTEQVRGNEESAMYAASVCYMDQPPTFWALAMRMRWQSFAYFKAEYYRRWPLPYRESRAYLEAQAAHLRRPTRIVPT
jgi:hypothetical protein